MKKPRFTNKSLRFLKAPREPISRKGVADSDNANLLMDCPTKATDNPLPGCSVGDVIDNSISFYGN